MKSSFMSLIHNGNISVQNTFGLILGQDFGIQHPILLCGKRSCWLYNNFITCPTNIIRVAIFIFGFTGSIFAFRMEFFITVLVMLASDRYS